jgi:hypothetical protein
MAQIKNNFDNQSLCFNSDFLNFSNINTKDVDSFLNDSIDSDINYILTEVKSSSNNISQQDLEENPIKHKIKIFDTKSKKEFKDFTSENVSEEKKYKFKDIKKNCNENDLSTSTSKSSISKTKLSDKIDLENIIIEKETRTLIVISNISKKMTEKKLRDEILYKNGFKDKINFFYYDDESKLTNKCYINFINSMDIILFFEIFNQKKYFNSKFIIKFSDNKIFPELKFCTMKMKNLYSELPLKYLNLFKKFHNSNYICIIKDKNNFYKEYGTFLIKPKNNLLRKI